MAVTPYGGRALLQVRTTRPCSNKIVSSAYLNSNFIIDFDFEGVITFAAISCS